jgi:hypothetical protein
MKQYLIKVIILLFLMLTLSCYSFPPLVPAPSATNSGSRTLILNGESVSEEDVGKFISWYCVDYVNENRILLEVGFFGDTKLKGLGFILYDGGYTGEFTQYRRTGVQHRWDWGPNGNDYAFVIQSDDIGLYYDFSSSNYNESTSASEVYKCYKR